MDWSSFWSGAISGVVLVIAFVWFFVNYDERKQRRLEAEIKTEQRTKSIEFDVKYHNELFFGPLGLISRVYALEQKVDLPKRRKDDARGAKA